VHVDGRLVIEARGRGEWIVSASDGGRPLHLYRMPGGDWLVSEVGRGNEGRGADLTQALAALGAGVRAPDWWESLPAAFDSPPSR
jgi:hypothetical protein